MGGAPRAPVSSDRKLRPSWPAPRTDRKDPYAVRAALLLGVVAAALAAGGNVSDRLRAAFAPAATSAPMLRLDAWVTPPVYTGIAPIVLADGSEKVGAGAESFRALSVPERSELIVRTHAPQGETVQSHHEPRRRHRSHESGPEEGRRRRARRIQRRAQRSAQRSGRDRRPDRFQMAVRSDRGHGPHHQSHGHADEGARCLAFRVPRRRRQRRSEAPKLASRSAKARSAISRRSLPKPPRVEADPLLEPPVMPLQLPRANAKRVDGRATQDLTAHPGRD